jgi:hypothetical protein
MRRFRQFDWVKHGPHILSFGPSYNSLDELEVHFYEGHDPVIFGPYGGDRNHCRDIDYLRKRRWELKSGAKSSANSAHNSRSAKAEK